MEDSLADKIKLVEKNVQNHMSDRFAHGWDHHLLITSQQERKEWQGWRDGVNKWRWTITGAIIVTAFEAPIVVGLFEMLIRK